MQDWRYMQPIPKAHCGSMSAAAPGRPSSGQKPPLSNAYAWIAIPIASATALP